MRSLGSHLREVVTLVLCLVSIIFVSWLKSPDDRAVHVSPPIRIPREKALDVISLEEAPCAVSSGEFRYFVLDVVDEEGRVRQFEFKAKKSLVADSVKCAIREFVPW